MANSIILAPRGRHRLTTIDDLAQHNRIPPAPLSPAARRTLRLSTGLAIVVGGLGVTAAAYDLPAFLGPVVVLLLGIGSVLLVVGGVGLALLGASGDWFVSVTRSQAYAALAVVGVAGVSALPAAFVVAACIAIVIFWLVVAILVVTVLGLIVAAALS